MGLLERILFWVAIFILLVGVIGEKSKLSNLEEQVAKAKNINVIYTGEDEESEEGDEGDEETEEDEEDNEGGEE